ncbi:UNVERIFIED_ORG: hypothetical protein GGE11_002675 [Mycolicibacterium obuense]
MFDRTTVFWMTVVFWLVVLLLVTLFDVRVVTC